MKNKPCKQQTSNFSNHLCQFLTPLAVRDYT